MPKDTCKMMAGLKFYKGQWGGGTRLVVTGLNVCSVMPDSPGVALWDSPADIALAEMWGKETQPNKVSWIPIDAAEGLEIIRQLEKG